MTYSTAANSTTANVIEVGLPSGALSNEAVENFNIAAQDDADPLELVQYAKDFYDALARTITKLDDADAYPTLHALKVAKGDTHPLTLLKAGVEGFYQHYLNHKGGTERDTGHRVLEGVSPREWKRFSVADFKNWTQRGIEGLGTALDKSDGTKNMLSKLKSRVTGLANRETLALRYAASEVAKREARSYMIA